MKAAVFHGPRDIRFEDVPKPELNDGEALMRIRACGICGSDLHTYREGLFPQLGLEIAQGRILGHEYSGEIVEIRGELPSIRLGGRYTTVSMGGNAEFLRITPFIASRMIPIPDDISFEEAATTEPLATSLHAVNLADPRDDQTLVIMGAGIIGLGILQAIKARCRARIIVVDLSARRLALAEQLGADLTLDASREDAVARLRKLHGTTDLSLLDSSESAIDTVFDCAGATAHYKGTTVLEQALGLVRQNGKVVVVAVFERKVEVDLNVVVRKGVQLLGSWAWTPPEFIQAMELIRSRKVDRKPLITHRFTLEQASLAYETQMQANEAIKVVLTP
jgi:2-desacetyl-2-hydroxyethyl bacteriochlorophyllide A dehydrogenase